MRLTKERVCGALALGCFAAATILIAAASPRFEASQSKGAPQSRVFLVFDKESRTVVRKRYTVWDASPEKRLEFEWIADRPSANDPGLVSGRGKLLWRRAGTSSYDQAALVSLYHGDMKQGRPEGQGEYRSRDGSRYEGEWRGGFYEGRGDLLVADGTNYNGNFKAGYFHGEGTLIGTGGETFVGTFARGLKHGPGKTRIGQASYSSIWTNGIEDVATRQVRLAQSPGAFTPLQFTPADIQIGLTVDPLVFARDPENSDYTLPYTLKNLESKFSIYPDDRELMSAWKEGGPLNINCCRNTLFRPVPVSFRVKNSSQKNLEIRSAFLLVVEGMADLQPLIVAAQSDECLSEPCTMFDLHNFGWSNPTQVKLDAALQPTVSGATKIPLSLPVAPDQKMFDVEPHLLALGANLKQLREWIPLDHNAVGLPCKDKNDAECIAHLRALGVLGRLADYVAFDEDDWLYAEIKATVAYNWKDARGTVKPYRAPFSISILLGTRLRPGTGEGASPPDKDPSTAFPVELKPGQTNLRISLPAKGTVAPSKELQIKLLLETRLSSQHKFRLGVVTADGKEHFSKDVNLQTFISSDWEARLKDYKDASSQ